MSIAFKQSDRPDTWVSKSRGEQRIADMEDFYLLNVVAHLRRRAAAYAERCPGVDPEALLARVPQYPTMMAEVARRGLGVIKSPAVRGAYDRFAQLVSEDAGGDQ